MSDNSKLDRKPVVKDLSTSIADAIRAEILAGSLSVDDRLPSEADLSEKYGVSRSTVREALKRLAAQSLIRTQRGASGGAFINRLTFKDAYEDMAARAILLITLNEVEFSTACRARFALERGCAPMAAQNRTDDHLQAMRTEITLQNQPDLSDEAFCASDVRFHRALVDSAQNPVLSWALASAVEGMQPLMNMITYRQRDRDAVCDLHVELVHALDEKDAPEIEAYLDALCVQTLSMARAAREKSSPALTPQLKRE